MQSILSQSGKTKDSCEIDYLEGYFGRALGAVAPRLARLDRIRAVEGLPCSRDFLEHGSGRESRPDPLFEVPQPAEDLIGAQLVHEAEWAAAKRREPEPKDRADVAIAGAS